MCECDCVYVCYGTKVRSFVWLVGWPDHCVDEHEILFSSFKLAAIHFDPIIFYFLSNSFLLFLRNNKFNFFTFHVSFALYLFHVLVLFLFRSHFFFFAISIPFFAVYAYLSFININTDNSAEIWFNRPTRPSGYMKKVLRWKQQKWKMDGKWEKKNDDKRFPIEIKDIIERK